MSLKNKIIVFCNIINCFYTLYVKNYSYSIEDGIVFSFGSCNLCSLVKINNIRLGCRKFMYTKGKKITYYQIMSAYGLLDQSSRKIPFMLRFYDSASNSKLSSPKRRIKCAYLSFTVCINTEGAWS